MNVEGIMTHPAFTCRSNDTLNAAAQMMWDKDCGAIPVLDTDDRPVGMITDRDIAMSAVLESGQWVINGEKTYISGAGDPRCRLLICMVKTDPDNARHQQHSQILVPMDSPGVEVVRPMGVFSMDDAPHGHADRAAP